MGEVTQLCTPPELEVHHRMFDSWQPDVRFLRNACQSVLRGLSLREKISAEKPLPALAVSRIAQVLRRHVAGVSQVQVSRMEITFVTAERDTKLGGPLYRFSFTLSAP